MSTKSQFPKLLESITIGNMTLSNRLVMPSMGNNYGTADGYVTDRLIDYYMERATDGPGLIMTEMVSMDEPMGRRGAHQLRIDNDSYIAELSRLTAQIHSVGRKMAVQLCHSGILAGTSNLGLLPLMPSAVENFNGIKARELTKTEIEHIINQFVKGAVRAKAANFDGIEVHAAHSYLLAHFLSPVWNKRTDIYGGNTKNRARILTDVISGIRAEVGPDFPLWCRMNGIEFGLEGGLSINEAQEIARLAVKAGCNALHISSGGYGHYYGYNRACMGNPRNNMAELAAEIKKVVNVPVIAVGRISLQSGEQLVRESKADLIAIGRGQIADPQLIKKALEGKFEDIRPCISCNTCVDDLISQDATLHCAVNACVGNERNTRVIPAKKAKKVLVVGGGPGGMESAVIAAQRGHQVIIWEKQPQLGGKLNLAVKPPHKDEIGLINNYLIAQISKLGIKTELGKTADAASIKTFNPDAVILAAGANPIIPKIEGLECGNTAFAEDVLAGTKIGNKVVIIGGGLVGCETAEFLAAQGKTVTIVEMLDHVAFGIGTSIKVALLYRLNEQKVKILTGVKCSQIIEQGVCIIDKDCTESIIASDTVVLAVGAKPDTTLFQQIQAVVKEIHQVGDCIEARRIINAIADGHRVGLSI